MTRCLAFASLIVASTAQVGCESSILSGSEVSVIGFVTDDGNTSSYTLSMIHLNTHPCVETESITAYTLDGVSLPSSGCAAGAKGILEDRTFRISVHIGEETGEMVVADMFPGLHATVNKPTDGRVAPGGEILVSVPPALQYGVPYLAKLIYTDSDDPTYSGEVREPNPTVVSGGLRDVASVRAPIHPGHFTLWIFTELPPGGTVTVCSGIGKCSAYASPVMGPMAIEVGP